MRKHQHVLSSLVVLALLLGFGLGASAQNLIENGSFEADDFPGEVGYFPEDQLEMTGWSKGGDGRWGINRSGDPWFISGMNAPDGNQVLFVQKNTDTDGATVSQDIEGLQDGQRYELSFYLNVRSGSADRPDQMDVWVTLGGVELLPITRYQHNGASYYFESIPLYYTEAEYGTDPTLTFHNSYEPGGDTSYTLDAVVMEEGEMSASIDGPGMVEIGDDVTLSVESDAIGETTYAWLKDGVELEGEEGDELILENLTEEDSGVYSVTVTDETGSTTVAFTLTVVEALPLSSTIGLMLLILAASMSGFVYLRRCEQ